MVELINTHNENTALQACASFDNRPDALLEIFHVVQASSGCVSDRAVQTIAKALNLSRADVHGVLSFYHDFKTNPGRAKSVQVCRAEACQAVGCEDLVDALAASDLFQTGQVKVSDVYCLGNYALGPAVRIGDTLIGRATATRVVSELLRETEPNG